MQHHILSSFFPGLNKQVTMVTMPYNSERPMMMGGRFHEQELAARRRCQRQSRFFTNFTVGKAIFYCAVALYWAVFSILCFVEPFLSDTLICDKASIPTNELVKANIKYNNPSYVYDPCAQTSLPYLLFLSRLQCNFGRRLLASGLFGGIVGWERREADRPAGIRTMALVSLGVCLFCINSMYAFWQGPMGWDSSRVAATIPSGVGFLGAGLIFKDAHKDDNSGATTHVVHGLTTAASLWISAAIGMACAGELYFVASFTVATILILLRFGPRQEVDVLDDEADDDEEPQEVKMEGNERDELLDPDRDYQSIRSLRTEKMSRKDSIRLRPSLGGIV